MANLVELSNQLEDFPEQQLVQMSQDPNSMYPSYLVLSEIQRRNQMRKMYEAQQPKPETTVAEEVIGEFTGQQGLQGAMAQSPGPQDAFPPSDMGNMAPPSPMQAMASGGRTGYQTGGSLGLGGDSLAGTFTNPNEVSIEEKDAVDKNIGQLYEQYGAPTLKAMKVLNEDGSINYINSALALASINPTFRLGKAAVGLGGRTIQKFAPKLLEKGKNFITKPGVKIQNPALKTGVQYGDDVIDPKTGAKIKQVITGPRTLKIPSAKGLLRGAGNLALPSLVVGNLIESGMERKAIEKEEARLLAEQKAAEQERLLAEQEAKIASEKAKQEAAIQAQIKKEKEQKQADMLVGLGGAIMSAKNIGELGTGISDVYTGIQTREDAKSLTGLQGRLLQAQASQIEANIAGMDLKELQASAKIIGDGLENGALTVEEYGPTFQAIADKIALLQGLQPKLGGETILAANEKVSGGN
tara:strand:- start:479 stop:1885 length:1407 start_codon:yes stop_codon:yes gene_type:complete